MPRKKVTPEVLEEMRRLREEGLSYGKIARRLGLNPMTIYNHLQKRRKKARITPKVVEGVVELRKQGFTYNKIAKELGIAFNTVAKYLQAKKLGGKRKVTEKVLEEMRNLKGEGLSYAKIADRLGLAPMTVYNNLKKGRMEGRKAGSLEKLMVKMEKWEPVHRKVMRDEVSVDKGGVDIFTWATGHFKGYNRADLYVDDKKRLLGIKPAANGQRSLVPKAKGRGFSVVCAPLMKQLGVDERKRVPAEWSEKGKMLLIDLRGYRRTSASTRLKSGA